MDTLKKVGITALLWVRFVWREDFFDFGGELSLFVGEKFDFGVKL